MNLLEKQLNTVYFKEVRFPWVTLYFGKMKVLSWEVRLHVSVL